MTLIDPAVEARITDLERHVNDLTDRVGDLEKNRPKRRGKQVQVREKGVCGLDPDRDSATCPDAGVYRHQQGCLGTACDAKNKEYYRGYRRDKRSETPVEVQV